MSKSHAGDKPEVIIVGAGLGGLMLGASLEQAGIPYHIFERAKVVKPLGSAIAIGGSVQPALEQLGIYEDLKAISWGCDKLNFYGEDFGYLGSLGGGGVHEKVTGYHNAMVSRPKFYELLLKKVPSNKITMNSKVLRTEEVDGRVIVYFSDNSKVEGDILVGADGAYSAVRQSLYKHMDQEGILPKSDLEAHSIGQIAMVGVAHPPNPEKYPILKDNIAHFNQVIGPNNHNWYTVNVPGNEICWRVGVMISQEEADSMVFRNSEWGPEANEALIKEFGDFPCPIGGKMSELFDITPKDLISRVFLEEKLFLTWHHGRTVLLGDACHKMLPGAGQGAMMAMHDAIAVGNAIYTLKDKSSQSIKAAFESYYDLHYPMAESRMRTSAGYTRLMNGQTWFARFLRYLQLNYLPHWLLEKKVILDYKYRPQIACLPKIEDRGSGKILHESTRGETDGYKAKSI